jgi:hypothetical protein
VGNAEFEAALWRDTDASLRKDPERWIVASAADPDPHDTRASGLRAYIRDAPDPHASPRGTQRRPRPGGRDFKEIARRSAETRRRRKAEGAYDDPDAGRWDV